MFQSIKKSAGKRKAQASGEVPWGSDIDTIEFLELDPASIRNQAEKETDARGFRLKGEPIQLEGGPDLYNHDAYTVLIDFSKKAQGDTGFVVAFEGSFLLWIGESGVIASVVTDVGERRLEAHADFAGPAWHRLALTFSGATGRAALYLDGQPVAATDDLKGAVQVGNYFADLYIGHPKGDSFTGRLDNFRFLDRALDAEQIAVL